MAPDYHLLRFGERLDLARVTSDRLQLVHATTRGTQLDVPAGMWSLWLPLGGELQLASTQSRWSLHRRHVLIARETLQGTSTESTWLALVGTQAAWSAAVRAIAPSHAGWLPRQWPCGRALLRALVQLARRVRDDDDAAACEAALRAVCNELLEQQRDLQPLIERCNGRTSQRRYLTLQRLLRVHQLIERDGESHLDLAQLAKVASYSPWHLIRMYRDVFGETPSEHLARLRLMRAWAMVRGSALPVCEITEKLGFESQSAFCRAFKNAYGLTTTQARHLPATATRQVNPRPAHVRPRTRPAQRLLSVLR